MKDRISLALERAGGGLIWFLGGFTLLILTAPFFWLGEALSDLRWHMGLVALLPALPGAVFLPRRRLTFVALAAIGTLNVLPALRVFVPPADEHFAEGDELSVMEVRWGHAPTAALEEHVIANQPDLLVVTGLDQVGRATLEEQLVDWPFVEAWPPILADGEGQAVPLEEDTTMLFSRLQLGEFSVTGFGLGACLAEAKLALGDLPVTLRVAVLPAPGPGAPGATRSALLDELETRSWSTRGILVCDLGSADTTPAYSELLDATSYDDARRGFGRMATIPAKILGTHVPTLWVPGEYLLHGKEVEVLDRKSEHLCAAERELIGVADDPNAPTRRPIHTTLRIKDSALQQPE